MSLNHRTFTAEIRLPRQKVLVVSYRDLDPGEDRDVEAGGELEVSSLVDALRIVMESPVVQALDPYTTRPGRVARPPLQLSKDNG